MWVYIVVGIICILGLYWGYRIFGVDPLTAQDLATWLTTVAATTEEPLTVLERLVTGPASAEELIALKQLLKKSHANLVHLQDFDLDDAAPAPLQAAAAAARTLFDEMEQSSRLIESSRALGNASLSTAAATLLADAKMTLETLQTLLRDGEGRETAGDTNA